MGRLIDWSLDTPRNLRRRTGQKDRKSEINALSVGEKQQLTCCVQSSLERSPGSGTKGPASSDSLSPRMR